MPGLTTPSTNASALSKAKVAVSRSNAPKADAAIPARLVGLHIESAIDALQPPRSNTVPVEYVTTAISDSTCPLSQQDEPQLPLTINELPPEILAEIFHTYMFSEDDSDLMNPELEGMVSVFLPNPRSAPLLFCGVCGYWRNVAISTPALWSAITIYDDVNLETVRLWLKRSQSHPLSLFVSWNRYNHKLPHLVEMLFTNMPRWRHVSFRLPTAKDMQQLLFKLVPQEGISPAIQLQHLHLSVEYLHFDHFSDFATRLSSFPHPTLQRLTWRSRRIPEFPHISKSLWANLQQISLSTPRSADLLSFLKACENIQFLNIECLYIEDAESPTTPASVVAPNLRSLNIGAVAGVLTEWLVLLSTPSLKRLSFGHQGGRGESIGLGNFLDRSGCKLESLCIRCRNPAFDSVEAEAMLRSSIFTAIPHISLRLAEDACPASFPQTIIAETAGQWKDTAYAYYEPKNYAYHLGWGTLDIARKYDHNYPFLVKHPKPIPKWWVALTEGPLTSA
ncbi:hypothetical protein CVT24_011723 [Panaeolus cyanescens]|uniref:Uncharacterized protein n=1 Tax=Panaeolus cyanescens TaxID=181874 RepID=A0A409YH80_9AGAR|nr:hypothetical protein CVT24_011723 [Panaeolus cyanescens]